MADAQATRRAGDPMPTGEDPSVRQVPPPVTLPQGSAEPSDDTPTIISKHPPLDQAIQASTGHEHFSGTLQGRKLAHFELLAPIGVGGMAAVLRARDMQLDRQV